MKIYKILVGKGEEVIEKANAQLAILGIVDGVVVSLIGAVDECCISNMPKGDANVDIKTTYAEPLEMSGSGEIKSGRIHLHCVFGRERDEAIFGHLHWAKVRAWYVAIYVAETSPEKG